MPASMMAAQDPAEHEIAHTIQRGTDILIIHCYFKIMEARAMTMFSRQILIVDDEKKIYDFLSRLL